MNHQKAISPLITTLLLIAIAVAASVLTYSWVMSTIGSQIAYAAPMKEFNITLFDQKNNLGVLGDVAIFHFILENPTNKTANYSFILIAPINNLVKNETFSIDKNGISEKEFNVILDDNGVWKTKILSKNTDWYYEKPFVVVSTKSDAQIAALAYSNQIKALKLSEEANNFSLYAIIISLFALGISIISVVFQIWIYNRSKQSNSHFNKDTNSLTTLARQALAQKIGAKDSFSIWRLTRDKRKIYNVY
jgi:flagellin-like protein